LSKKQALKPVCGKSNSDFSNTVAQALLFLVTECKKTGKQNRQKEKGKYHDWKKRRTYETKNHDDMYNRGSCNRSTDFHHCVCFFREILTIQLSGCYL